MELVPSASRWGADLPPAPSPVCADPSLQGVFLRGAEKARAAAHVEAGQALDPVLFEEVAPAADRVIVEQERVGGLPATPAVVQQHKSIRPPRHSMRRRAIPRQRDRLATIFFAEESTPKHALIGIRPTKKPKRFPQTRGFCPTLQ